ncbi:N-acetylmuramoyl-L-alanine amidase [Pseudalkalibacillus hwajinpoensis]|uniref:N-acetylmuramoyl-L-alanine amidase n=1 Tax=Guptibacillus hwajinpoensis TaxID=208199 RepID=UPI00325AAD37
MKLIVIDPGHGGADPGAMFKNYQEKNFNFAIARMIRDRLVSKYDVEVIMTRETDKNVDLKSRTDLANVIKADFFLSIHHNAAGGSGFESYIFNGSIPSETVQLQANIHDKLASTVLQKYSIRNRGKKRADFHVLRETKMSALLLEVLFIDNEADLKLMTNPTFLMEMATGIADATATALNLPVAPVPTEGLFKVIVGSFSKMENAEEQLKILIQKGFNAFIATATITNSTVYRVQAGAFKEKENAEALAVSLNKAGFETFILYEGSVPDPPEEPPEPDKGYKIEGKTVLTTEQMDSYVRSINPNAPLLGALYASYSQRYGIRGDVAFAQAIHETNFFRFTGDVRPEQNNFAGIGATGGGTRGATFSSPATGVLAHIQHLYAYSSTASLPKGDEKADPRFGLVKRGSATTWQALNGKWAVPGTNYGQLVLTQYKKMVQNSLISLNMEREKLQNTLNTIDI